MCPTSSDSAVHGVYDAITDVVDDARWAYGTGFHAPNAELQTPPPDDAPRGELTQYCTQLGDDALVMSQRLQQWLTRAPELEEETALANIALDLLGQATLLYERAVLIEGTGRTADDLAFLREPAEFTNVEVAEWVDDDFAALVCRLLVFTTWRLAICVRLRASRDPGLAAIAASAVKELTYHRDYAAQWVIRLGDGTDYSAQRTATGWARLADGYAELFTALPAEMSLASLDIAVNPATVRREVDDVLADVCRTASLNWQPLPTQPRRTRRDVHTAGFDTLIAELQSVARANPGATW